MSEEAPIHKLGYNLIIDLGHLGSEFYQDLFDYFVTSRMMSREFEAFVQATYDLCMTEFVRTISPSQAESVGRLAHFPNTNVLHQITMAIPPDEHDELIRICHTHGLAIYLFIYRQLERYNEESNFMTICYITGKIQLDLMIITEVYLADSNPIQAIRHRNFRDSRDNSV